MDIQKIKYALAVETALSFTKAAEHCGVSQPALTSGVKKLENQLGGELFHRDGKTITISQFGKAMLPDLKDLLVKSAETFKAAQAFHQLDQIPLRLGVLVTIGPEIIAPLLGQFQKSNPGVDVTVEEGTLEDVQLKLDNNELDAAILSSADLIQGNYRIEPLYVEKFVVVLPPNHPYSNKDQLTLKDLDKQNYVDRLSCEMRERIWSNCEGYKVDLYARFRSQRDDWIGHMINANLGFAFMPENAAIPKDCITKPLLDPEIERTINLVTVPGRRHQPSLKAFLNCIRDTLRSQNIAENLSKSQSANGKIPIEKLAKRIFEAQITQAPVLRFTSEFPDMNETDSYQIQNRVVQLHGEAGHSIVGWKIAAANKQIMKQLGITKPLFGRMLDFNNIPNGGDFTVKDLKYLVPEVEICLRLSKDLKGLNISQREAVEAIGGVAVAFELVMPRFKDWNFGYQDAIADNAGFTGYVLGNEVPFNPLTKLSELKASLLVNGETVQTGVGKNALGGPISSLIATVNKLSELGMGMKAGELYLSGSLIPKHHLTEPCQIEGHIDGLGSVELKVLTHITQ